MNCLNLQKSSSDTLFKDSTDSDFTESVTDEEETISENENSVNENMDAIAADAEVSDDEQQNLGQVTAEEQSDAASYEQEKTLNVVAGVSNEVIGIDSLEIFNIFFIR